MVLAAWFLRLVLALAPLDYGEELWRLAALSGFGLYLALWVVLQRTRMFEGRRSMFARSVALGAFVFVAGSALAADTYQLPPEVTPALRSACEGDVRRLCIGEDPSVSKVKRCIAAKFLQLGKRCQMQIALAGLRP